MDQYTDGFHMRCKVDNLRHIRSRRKVVAMLEAQLRCDKITKFHADAIVFDFTYLINTIFSTYVDYMRLEDFRRSLVDIYKTLRGFYSHI